MLILGGIAAGFVNTLAGGGSFITVPLLVMIGLPPTVANATNRVGVFVQSAAAVSGFRQEGISEARLSLSLLPATLLGSWVGAWIASSVPDAVFGRAFGVLMLLALPLILLNPRPSGEGGRRALALPLQHAIYFALGVYGGAIQAGIGIPLLLALVAFSGLDLVRANSAKVVIVAALTTVAIGQFIWADKIRWAHGIVLAIGTGLGGYVAARTGARVGPRLIRPVLAAAVVALAARLLIWPE